MTEVHQGLPFPRRILAIISIFIGSMMLMIDTSIASVVLPTIAKELNVPNSSIVFVVTAYQLILAMTLMPFAALGDRVGHRRLFQAGLLLHSSAALMSFFANSFIALVAVRSLQAVGTAAALSMSIALLRGIYPVQRLGAGLSLNTIANASGTSVAPIIGGLIVSVASWHWVFTAAIPLSLIALAFSHALPDPEPRKHSFDVLGAALCALTFGLVITGLEAAIHSAHLLLSLGIVGAGAVVGWFFVRHELSESDPVLPIDLLMLPPIALSTISCFTAILGSIILMLFIPFRLQHAYGFTPGEVGGVLAAYAVGSLMFAPLAGILSDRIAVPLLSTIGMTIASIALLSLALLPIHPTQFDLIWRIWLCGVGFGIFSSPNARFIVASAPTTRTASAGSIYSTTRMLSQAIGATLVAALLALGLGNGPVPALVAMGLAIVAGAISVFSLRLAKRNVVN